MEVLCVLLVAAGALILIPILAFKVLFSLVLLPFRIVGAVFGVLFGLVGGLVKLAFSGFVAIGVLCGLVLCVVLLPLLPFILIGGFIFLLIKAFQPHAVA